MSAEGELRLLFVFLILSPIFSSTEIGYLAVSLARVRRLREQGVRTAGLLCFLKRHRPLVLSTILVGITASNYMAERLAVEYSLHISPSYGPIVAYVIMLVIVLVFCEVIPIQFASRNPLRVALYGSIPAIVLTVLLFPIVTVMAGISRLLLRIGGLHAKTVLPTVTEDQLKAMIDAGEEQGALAPTESRMLRGALQFGDYTVAQIMTPRPDMVCVEETDTLKHALTTGLAHRYSKLPVYKETTDDITGILHLKDILSYAFDGDLDLPAAEIMRPAMHVPEDLLADALLRRLQSERSTIAIAKDEYGGTAGLVTVEDLLEEIVGEIRDEYDDHEEPEIIKVAEGEFVCSARVSLHRLQDELTREQLPTEDYESLAGLLLDIAGDIPEPGEEIAYQDLTLVIEQMDGTRIERIRVIERPAA